MEFKTFLWLFLVEFALPKKTLQVYFRQEPNVQYLDSLFKATNIYEVSNSSWEPLKNRHLIPPLCTFRNVPSDLDFDRAVKIAWRFKVTLFSDFLSLNLFQWENYLNYPAVKQIYMSSLHVSQCNTKLPLRDGIN